MDDANEVWRPVVGYEGVYSVSSRGRVFSHPRRRAHGGLLRPAVNADGYPIVCLSKNHQRKMKLVHRLMMEAFVGPCPQGQEARHLDGDPGNLALQNLAYGTRSENRFDAVRHGTHGMTRRTRCKQGHEYTLSNTYIRPSRPTRRDCRTCRRLRKL